MAVTHTTPLTTAPRTPLVSARPRPADGADFEAPLYTAPYPVRDCKGATLDTRDILNDEGLYSF